MKLIPGANFINNLKAAFAYPDPKSTKKTDTLTFLIALSGSEPVKAGFRTLIK